MNVNREGQSGVKTRRLLDWSPHSPNQFVVGSTDLRLFELNSVSSSSSLPSNNSKGLGNGVKKVVVKGINYEVSQVRCVGWNPVGSKEGLVACGLPSGKVVLATFSSSNRIVKEFVPKHSRACNCLAWNPLQPNRLAAGLDKVRGDCSTLVWDINQQGILPTDSEMKEEKNGLKQGNEYSFNLSPVEAAESVMNPMQEMANSEATTALAWDPSNANCLVTGTGVKWLRIYDLRADTNSPQSVVAHSKSVQGVSFDPFKHERLATFSEDGIIKFWDVRNFVEPVFSLVTNSKGLQQVEWCPKRSGVLASSSRDEKSIKFWDIQDAMVGQKHERDDFNASHSRPYRCHEGTESYSSFSWDPSNQHRLLTINNSGILEVVTLQQTIPIKWSPKGHLSFSYGNKQSTLLLENESNTVAVFQGKLSQEEKSFAKEGKSVFDVSVEMRKRAQLGYSMDIAHNKKLMDSLNAGELCTLWNWMADYLAGVFPKEISDTLFQGIHAIFKSTNANSKKTNEKTSLPFPIFLSPQRQFALQICGWGFDKKDSLDQAVQRLESNGHYERAAAICVFHIDLKRAMGCLLRGTNAISDAKRIMHLRYVHMALAGCNEQALASGFWKEACLEPSMFNEIQHPYLKACLAFLCNDSGKGYRSVLEDQNLSLADRVGFACKFLDDNELLHFIETSIQENQKKGNVEGIILTGLDGRAMEIFEQFVNSTGDVQTAALVMAHLPKKLRDNRVDIWIKSYRDLLDVWELWHARAKFDIALKDPISPQVYVRCNFCNQALAMSLITSRRGPNQRIRISQGPSQTSSNFHKQTSASCPGCKKPLPRCVVCLLPFNVNVPNAGRQTQATAGSSTDFGNWFTWCQSCRHGGHAAHMMDWFRNHRECPVSDCKCTQCGSFL